MEEELSWILWCKAITYIHGEWESERGWLMRGDVQQSGPVAVVVAGIHVCPPSNVFTPFPPAIEYLYLLLCSGTWFPCFSNFFIFFCWICLQCRAFRQWRFAQTFIIVTINMFLFNLFPSRHFSKKFLHKLRSWAQRHPFAISASFMSLLTSHSLTLCSVCG